PEAGLAHPPRRLQAHGVARRSPVLQREVEALDRDVRADHGRVEHPERLLEELLSRLVALQRDYADRGHGEAFPVGWTLNAVAGAGRRSRPTTAFAPTSPRGSAARSSAGSSTSCPGASRAR